MNPTQSTVQLGNVRCLGGLTGSNLLAGLLTLDQTKVDEDRTPSLLLPSRSTRESCSVRRSSMMPWRLATSCHGRTSKTFMCSTRVCTVRCRLQCFPSSHAPSFSTPPLGWDIDSTPTTGPARDPAIVSYQVGTPNPPAMSTSVSPLLLLASTSHQLLLDCSCRETSIPDFSPVFTGSQRLCSCCSEGASSHA